MKKIFFVLFLSSYALARPEFGAPKADEVLTMLKEFAGGCGINEKELKLLDKKKSKFEKNLKNAVKTYKNVENKFQKIFGDVNFEGINSEFERDFQSPCGGGSYKIGDYSPGVVIQLEELEKIFKILKIKKDVYAVNSEAFQGINFILTGKDEKIRNRLNGSLECKAHEGQMKKLRIYIHPASLKPAIDAEEILNSCAFKKIK